MSTGLIEVAAGVLVDAAGRVLIARRPAHKHQGGLWEFPGGKLEPGETAEAALARELSEELGIVVVSSAPLLEVDHDYGERRVRLWVRQVSEWRGEPFGAEGQPLAWVARQELDRFEFPSANASIVEVLRRPSE